MSATVDTLTPLNIETAAIPPAQVQNTATPEPRLPQIQLPGNNRMVSEFASELGVLLGPSGSWFVKDNRVVRVESRQLSDRVTTQVFRETDASSARTAIERHVVPGIYRPTEGGGRIFSSQTIGKEAMQTVLDSDHFKGRLPRVERILDLPLPMLHEGNIVRVNAGHDPRFFTYCPVEPMAFETLTLEEARQVFEQINRDFCLVDETARTMAVARMLTPYCRGLMGFGARGPVWLFEGNRPRAGKDYLAGCTTVLYEGNAHEDLPLGRSSEETQKRILAAALSGRRIMHFANCKGHLDDPAFEYAATTKVLSGRILGRNDAGASVQVANELEFSLSANSGFTYSEDFSLRCRKITLSFMQEDANARQFSHRDLHGWIRENRLRILSALETLVRHWDQQGRPCGTNSFASFPEWARVVGGIMVCCGLGDPCVSQANEGLTQDEGTEHMGLLFAAIHCQHGTEWISKSELLRFLGNPAYGELFPWLDLDDRSHQTRFGRQLKGFSGRELGGLKLETDWKDKSRPRYRVVSISPAAKAASEPADLRTCEPCEPFSVNMRNQSNVSNGQMQLLEGINQSMTSSEPGQNGSQGSQVRTVDPRISQERARLRTLRPNLPGEQTLTE